MSVKKLSNIFLFIFIYSWTPIFIKMLGSEYDVITQNFYRFIFADVALFAIGYYFYKDDLKKAFRNIKLFLFPAAINTVVQYLMVAAIVLTTAVLGSLISKLSVVSTIALSWIFLKSERKIIKSKYFLIGIALAIIGFIGVVSAKGDVLVSDFNLAIIYFIIIALLVAVYRISIKKMVAEVHPFAAFTMICFLMTLFFIPGVILFGDLSRIFTASTNINAILIFSGVINLSLANGFYYKSVKDYGVSIPNTLLLILPFTTGAFSYFVLGELLTTMQIVFGTILIIGCYVLMKKAKRVKNEVR
jgi:drug/metabolite transporter (DMT)-like permease